LSVGIYPDRNYQTCVDFGAARQAPVVVTPSFLHTLWVHLSTLCEHLCKQEPYKCNELSFLLQTVTGGVEPAAKFTNDRRYITLKVGELKHLLLNMSSLVRQLARYTMAEKDVSEYVHSFNASTSFVAPKETASLFVQYDVYFDVITGKLKLSFS
jgi:hypothetical protein